ncbi:MAG: TIGR02147 family protein [Bdellovibrionales bacterium]|nr:TIGR02147 family protein [Bdellovibrionales bacterium]
MQTEQPLLASYTDYRQYLKDFYNFKKQTASTPIRSYSYATFSAAADIKSPNYLKLIIDGQRNLSDGMIKKFAKALNLSKTEIEEFAALVHYGQAKDPLERNRCLKVLADIRVKHQMKKGQIKEEIMNRVPSWVTWVLYSLADQEGVDFNLNSLRQILRGRVTQDEIQKALDALIDKGELKLTESGQIEKGRKLMEGSSDIPPALVRKLQAELIYLGMESLFQDEPTEREFGAFTMALTKEEFEQVKFEVRQLRKRLYTEFSVKREQSKGERVYQLNFQLFPVSEKSLNKGH